MEPTTQLSGVLHVAVAFDWADEIDLNHASRLWPAELQSLPRRHRTPTSIEYQVPPLLVRLPAQTLALPELGEATAAIEATMFDFGAASVTLRIPFRAEARQLSRLAARLAQPGEMIQAAREAVSPVFERIRPALQSPHWSELGEEYVVFQFAPEEFARGSTVAELTSNSAEWLAGLLRLDDAPLSAQEVEDALRLKLSYGRDDIVFVDWSAAVIIDADCADSLRTMEFANIQLLELRILDQRVDDALKAAYGLVTPPARSWLLNWRLQSRPLRLLGEMRMSTVVLFERTSSALKLVGDQYLARLYRLLATRFRLEEWSSSIRTSLDATEGVYEVLSQQSGTFRIELLEVIIVVLIMIEIVLSLTRG